MRGKLIENCKIQTVFPGQQYTQSNSAVCYGRPIDTKGMDEVVFNVECEQLLNNNSLAIQVNENSTPDPIGSVAVTGASFTTVTTSNDSEGRKASIKCSEYKRYLIPKATFSGGGGAFTGSMSMTAILKSNSAPVDQTVDFDVDNM